MSTEFIARPAPPPITKHYRIVVGFDGSAGSFEAVEWAAREAEGRVSALRIVSCWAMPADVDLSGVGAQQQRNLADVVDDTRRHHPGLVIESTATHHRDPREDLIAATEEADLLVIGSSASGIAHQMLLGSVARTATRHSACPVVVTNGTAARPIGRIVVGVDGSKAAETALEWACAEASLHGSVLTIVHAREASTFVDEAQRILETAVAECRARTSSMVSTELAEGTPAEALVRASDDADLIVVGSRGRGAFTTAVFGSVALTVAEHAACPVAMTHPRIRHQ